MKPTHWQPSNESQPAAAQDSAKAKVTGKSTAHNGGINGNAVGQNLEASKNGDSSDGESRNGEAAIRETLVWRCEHEIDSDPAAGQRVLEELLLQLEAQQWLQRDIFGVHLATEEAIVNAILHGNSADKNKRVHVVCVLSPDRLRVEITDEGPGFNPDALPDPTRGECLHAAGGRGVMLMRSFMSRVEFNQRGNRVMMEKERCQGES
jgi:serine/threonine-protein kinase RsbW